MRKGLAYLDMAEKCRVLAGQVKEATNKKQLDDMAQEWERMASERVKDATAAAKYAAATASDKPS
jgi:hypothetical protein